jgi:hypothetical protein
MIRRIACTVLLAALPGASTSGLSGQTVSAGAVQAWPDQSLLGSPLGFRIAVGKPFDRVGVRLGLELYSDDRQDFGSTCGGFVVSIEDCAPEPLSDRSHMRALTVQTPIPALSHDRVAIAVVPGVRLSWLGSARTGQITGRTLDADEVVFGVDLGAEVSLVPVAAWPIEIRVGGSLGLLYALRGGSLDGYDPFTGDAFYVPRMQIALSFVR